MCAPAWCCKTRTTSPWCAYGWSVRQGPLQPPVCRLCAAERSLQNRVQADHRLHGVRATKHSVARLPVTIPLVSHTGPLGPLCAAFLGLVSLSAAHLDERNKGISKLITARCPPGVLLSSLQASDCWTLSYDMNSYHKTLHAAVQHMLSKQVGVMCTAGIGSARVLRTPGLQTCVQVPAPLGVLPSIEYLPITRAEHSMEMLNGKTNKLNAYTIL